DRLRLVPLPVHLYASVDKASTEGEERGRDNMGTVSKLSLVDWNSKFTGHPVFLSATCRLMLSIIFESILEARNAGDSSLLESPGKVSFAPYIRFQISQIPGHPISPLEGLQGVGSRWLTAAAWIRVALKKKRVPNYLTSSMRKTAPQRRLLWPLALLLRTAGRGKIGILVALKTLSRTFCAMGKVVEARQLVVSGYTPNLGFEGRHPHLTDEKGSASPPSSRPQQGSQPSSPLPLAHNVTSWFSHWHFQAGRPRFSYAQNSYTKELLESLREPTLKALAAEHYRLPFGLWLNQDRREREKRPLSSIILTITLQDVGLIPGLAQGVKDL
uniref:Uncharacterized protein n=1 Tax=Sus scrofa TaxID=9823 RepID=A0A8D0SC24_PIG